ncbi:MAG: hypothetical protein KGH98_03250 [Candidatus Micrarchaeota archaeon]|nr:hypothetical protein [Candidatus Micrarchaeota archaeon]
MQSVTISTVNKVGVVPIMVGIRHRDEPLVLMQFRMDRKVGHPVPEIGAKGRALDGEDARITAANHLRRETGISISLMHTDPKHNYIHRNVYAVHGKEGNVTIVKADYFAQVVSSRNRGNGHNGSHCALEWMRFGDAEDALVDNGYLRSLEILDKARKFWQSWNARQSVRSAARKMIDGFVNGL